jgi:hypothetical protein
MTYLDIGDAIMEGDWRTAANGLWSPLYPLLLGVVTHLLRLPRAEEINAVRLTNFAVYLVAVACFDSLVRRWLGFLRVQRMASAGVGRRPLPNGAAMVVAYLVFISSSLVLLSPESPTPDMCLAATVYLACGILARIHTGGASRAHHALLGIVLGFGYLTKTAMFPLAFVFMLVSLPHSESRQRLAKFLALVFGFGLVATPLIFCLSIQKGRLTFGDTGKLNYAWEVNQVPHRYWRGGPPGSGVPEHPPRKLHDGPAIYEFATPVRGTNPLTLGHSYWYEGVRLRFNLSDQLKTIRRSIETLVNICLNPKQLPWIVFGLGSLSLVVRSRGDRMATGSAFVWVGFLLVPALAALTMYSLVQFVPRYIGPFMAPLALAVLAGIRIPETPEARSAASCFAVAVAIAFIVSLASPTGKRITRLFEDAVHGQRLSEYKEWRIAEALQRQGIRPGDEVACIGDSLHVYWARLARLRVMANVPDEARARESDKFWRSTPRVQNEVIRLLKTSGADAIVAGPVPTWAPTEGWSPVSGTDYFIRVGEADAS